MTQFWMAKEKDLENLQYCLDNFVCHSIFIRLMGSQGGHVQVSEELNGRKLSFKNEGDLKIFIDKVEVFKFTEKQFKGRDKGFSIEERNHNGIPYFDSKTPNDIEKPYKTALRAVWGDFHTDYLIEIEFYGKIPLIEDGCFYEQWKRYDILKKKEI